MAARGKRGSGRSDGRRPVRTLGGSSGRSDGRGPAPAIGEPGLAHLEAEAKWAVLGTGAPAALRFPWDLATPLDS